MNIVKNILLVISIVAVLSVVKCDNRSTSQRFKRHDTLRRIKRTSFSLPRHLPYDYSDNDDGFYVLDLKLIERLCSRDESNCIANTCKWYIEDFKFQLYNKKNPCHNFTVDFNEEKISSIQSSIDEKWGSSPNWKLYQMSDFTWKFSGSCSLRIPELDDEFKFFKKSIDLYDKFSIGKNLEDKDIIIGGDYSIEEMSDAISGVLGGNYAQLGCTEGKNWWKDLNYPRFNELIIFLDKQFSPIKNPGWRKHGYRLQDCQRNVTVYYDV